MGNVLQQMHNYLVGGCGRAYIMCQGTADGQATNLCITTP